MTQLFFHFLAVLALLAVLVGLVIREAGRPLPRVLALMLMAVTLAVAWGAGSDLLGRPKPAQLALLERGAEEATVVASLNAEGEAIYLWLILPGDPRPRAYALPWSIDAAEALRRAGEDAEGQGTEIRMRLPFGHGVEDDEPKFYARPPPPLPPKG